MKLSDVDALFAKAKADLLARYTKEQLRAARTMVHVDVVVACGARADTGMPCDLPPGHDGQHFVSCKDQRFTHDHPDAGGHDPDGSDYDVCVCDHSRLYHVQDLYGYAVMSCELSGCACTLFRLPPSEVDGPRGVDSSDWTCTACGQETAGAQCSGCGVLRAYAPRAPGQAL